MDSEPRRPGSEDGPGSLSLRDPRQRRILSILADRSGPMSVPELCTRLAASERDVDRSAVSGSEAERIRLDLDHRCLPKLEEVGLVERRPDGVVAGRPPSVESGCLSVPDIGDPEHPDWDAVGVVLARPYRETLVSALVGRDGGVTLDELARRLRRTRSQASLPGDGESVRLALHHVDLPQLASVGLVEYDADRHVAVPTARLDALWDGTTPGAE